MALVARDFAVNAIQEEVHLNENRGDNPAYRFRNHKENSSGKRGNTTEQRHCVGGYSEPDKNP